MKRINSSICRFLRQTQGVSAVEFCIVLPPLLLVLYGLIEFGNIMLQKNTVSAAAMNGARLASTYTAGSPPAGITQSALQTNVRNSYNDQTLTVAMAVSSDLGSTWTNGGTITPGASPATTVKVTVSKSVQLLFPGVMSVFFETRSNPSGDPISVSESCTQQAQF